jgi:hypothetical protein
VALFRRSNPPARAVELVAAGERLLSWATVPGGSVVVASDRALYLPTAHGAERIPYETVQTATWDDPLLTVILVGDGGRGRTLRLEETGSLPAVVRERVTSTVVVTERVRLTGSQGALVIARRPPGSDEVVWQVVFDAGLDASDPGLRAEAAQAVERVRESTGL